MVMECFGSMAMPENQGDGEASEAAISGTASHELAARCLKLGTQAADYIGEVIIVKDDDGVVEGRYELDYERADRVQAYVDDVRRDAMGGILWVEHRVDLSQWLGTSGCPVCHGYSDGSPGCGCETCDSTGEVPQGGTSDAVIIQPRKKRLKISDLKDGQEKVYASYEHTDGTKRINHQMGQYALGALDDATLAGYEIDTVEVEIQQPRLGWVDRFEISAFDLIAEFGVRLRSAIAKQNMASVLSVKELDAKGYLIPGKKQCRWCRAVVRCPAYRRQLEAELKMDFDDLTSEPALPKDTTHLATAYRALPMVRQWVKAVESGVWNGVLAGDDIIGADGQPLKIVQGADGKRTWDPEALLTGGVEAILNGQLGPAAYEPPQIITAPVAHKLIIKKCGGKKKAEALWATFEPLIKKAKGAAQLVLGSDPRPRFGEASAVATDFDDEIGVDE